MYGTEGLVLKWMKSYITELRQCVVVVDKVNTDFHPLKYGVPQGSIIGPKQFVLYTGPVSVILKRMVLMV